MFLLFLVKMFATHLKRPKRRVERRTDRTNGHRQVGDDIDHDDDVFADDELIVPGSVHDTVDGAVLIAAIPTFCTSPSKISPTPRSSRRYLSALPPPPQLARKVEDFELSTPSFPAHQAPQAHSPQHPFPPQIPWACPQTP